MKRQWASLLALGLIAAATPVAAQSQIGVGADRIGGRELGIPRPLPSTPPPVPREPSEIRRGEVDSVILDDGADTPIHITVPSGPLSCPPGQHLRTLGSTRQCVPDAVSAPAAAAVDLTLISGAAEPPPPPPAPTPRPGRIAARSQAFSDADREGS